MRNVYLIFLFSFVFCGCISMMEKTGRIIDGSAFEEKTVSKHQDSDFVISIVENRSKEKSIIIAVKRFPMIKFRGTLPDEDGNFLFTSLEYLAGSTHGWNEFSLQLLGKGRASLNNSLELEITEEIEHIQITQGRIHRYDTRIIGNDALTALRNRRDRIEAAIEWMSSFDDPPSFNSIEDFEKHWKPVLFPELVSRRKRPQGFRQDGDIYLKAEDIRWNTGYSERSFPEELRPIRNSGTLLRDWEEALSWFYFKYEWNTIF